MACDSIWKIPRGDGYGDLSYYLYVKWQKPSGYKTHPIEGLDKKVIEEAKKYANLAELYHF